jgi:hypothetical protein
VRRRERQRLRGNDGGASVARGATHRKAAKERLNLRQQKVAQTKNKVSKARKR